MFKTLVGAVVGLAMAASAGWAQVEARTVTPEEAKTIETGKAPSTTDQQMKSPMLLEIPLRSVGGLPLAVWMEKVKSPQWTSSAGRQFVCDRARVSRITFQHKKPKKDFVTIDLGAGITSGWFRQDLDVTLALVGLDGKEIGRQFWDNETVGNDSGVSFGGRSKLLHLETKVPRA